MDQVAVQPHSFRRRPRRDGAAGAHDEPAAVSPAGGDLSGNFGPQLPLRPILQDTYGVEIAQDGAASLDPRDHFLDLDREVLFALL